MMRQALLAARLRRAIFALRIFTRQSAKSEDEEKDQGPVVNQSDIRPELTIKQNKKDISSGN